MQLRAAVAFDRPQDIARETCGMQADEDRGGPIDLADLDGIMFFAATTFAEDMDPAARSMASGTRAAATSVIVAVSVIFGGTCVMPGGGGATIPTTAGSRCAALASVTPARHGNGSPSRRVRKGPFIGDRRSFAGSATARSHAASASSGTATRATSPS